MLIQTLSEDRIEEVLAYLVATDDEYANLKASVERTKHQAKRAEALEILSADGSAQVRKAQSEVAAHAVAAWNRHWDEVAEFEKMRAKRETHVMIIEVWRSFTSARKQGVHL